MACGDDGATTQASGVPAPAVTQSNPTAVPVVESSIIAWRDRPAPATTAGSRAPAPDVARCDATMLAVGSADPDGGPGLGTNYWRVPLTNDSTVPCSLPAAGTTATAIDATGGRVDLGVGQAEDDADRVLDPGDRGELVISAGNVCYLDSQRTRDIAFGSLTVTLPSSGTLSIPDLRLVLCGPQINVEWRRDSTLPRAGSLASLAARIEPIGTVAAGQPLDYVVELTNPSTRDVALTPCPSYVQTVIDEQKSAASLTHDHYQLNCSSLTLIAAGSTIRFAMHINIPNGLHGPGFLNWNLDDGPTETTTFMTN